ncbi:anthranilate synthase component II [Propionigenium maris DSM 9537]|uniref:Anthranilate synthase component II n=1 Tax=Propionigenium maris DSM 9537 TaxID=1123000 RepID=A0A9W6LLX2_9FUSO|nr:gamma-glutamyl-gamma-aminobutyrate hydrolase family protein [Propionigenium maris]GLI54828.1 anthranilate synthase component II [Propionigenium maris DSM 9537]
MKKKVVGVSGNRRSWSDFERDYVNTHYTDSIEMAGAVPLILPITTREETIKSYIDMVDVLILSGGHDMDPVYYNEEVLPEGDMPFRDRDAFDMLLIRYAVEKGIPILGICRGMQVLNVYFGGSLYQDLKYNKNVYLKHIQESSPGEHVHKVAIEEDSVLSEIFGEELWVNSYHHQLVKEVGEGLKVTGRASDMAVELIEWRDSSRFIVGVQWHPEMMYSSGSREMGRIFKLLLEWA